MYVCMHVWSSEPGFIRALQTFPEKTKPTAGKVMLLTQFSTLAIILLFLISKLLPSETENVYFYTHTKKKKKKPNIKNSFTQFKYQLLRTNELTIPLPISMARVASVVLLGTKMCFITNSSIPVINWQSILG